jgi:2-haloacid dehalogenase
MTALPGIRACVFDAYGTLFDFASAAARCEGVPDDRRAALTALWRDKQLQYSWLRALQGRYADFWRVTSDALHFTLESLGLEDAGLHARLMALYLTLRPFREVPETLAKLKIAGFRLAILSNGTPAMLAAIVEGVLSVDTLKTFKTDRAVYAHASKTLGLDAERICFCSSNGWDAHAASDFGMKVAWINRQGQRAERLPGKPDLVLGSLGELPALLAAPS